jgi:uncharacterized membrane protein
MNRFLQLGYVLFAAGLIGLGLDHILLGKFATGRAPDWPPAIPGGLAWTYLSGLAFVAAGLAILARRHGRAAAIFAAVVVFFWALLRHIPVLAGSPFPSGDWTNAAKALRFVGGALAVAATLPKLDVERGTPLWRFMNLERAFIVAGRICVAPTLVVNGIQHFVFPRFVASLIPAWFPGDAAFWTAFGGVALIAGGVGLLIPRTARRAALASGLMIFSWFLIVHVSREIAGAADGIAVFEALLTAGMLFVLTTRTNATGSSAAAPDAQEAGAPVLANLR